VQVVDGCVGCGWCRWMWMVSMMNV